MVFECEINIYPADCRPRGIKNQVRTPSSIRGCRDQAKRLLKKRGTSPAFLCRDYIILTFFTSLLVTVDNTFRNGKQQSVEPFSGPKYMIA